MQSKIYLKLKNSLLCIVFVVVSNFLMAQDTYTKKSIQLGDSIVMELPKNRDGRFIDIEEMDSLKKTLLKDKKNIIKINVFFGSKKFSQAYSDRLKISLNKFISDLKIDYCIISNGNEYPIIKDKSDKNYKLLNNRLVILYE